MLPRATEYDVAGHIWPAGRYLPTPALRYTLMANRMKTTFAQHSIFATPSVNRMK